MTAWKDALRAAATPEALREALAVTSFERLSPGDVGLLVRRWREFTVPPQVRIAYAGNHTIEPLPDYVSACGLCAGVADGVYVAPYNQYVQAVLGESSELVTFAPHLIVLLLDLRELAPQLVGAFGTLSPDAVDAERERIVRHILDWVEAAKRATSAHFLVGNFALPQQWQAGIADQKAVPSEQAFYLRLNLDLLERLRAEPRAHVLDVERILASCGKARAISPKMYFLARMAWQEGALPRLAEEISRYVHILLNRTRKCLVLDLDNTLWGGIVGEEGAEGIKIGKGGPVEEAFFAFQQYLLALKGRGVVLAIASKNNFDDVAEVFDSRPEMPLKFTDFAVSEINWNDKPDSLVRIARSLNIGTDSLVFVDDNPAECALVKSMLPEIEVIHLAGDPAGFVDILQRQSAFERLQITDEDRRKTQSYQEAKGRVELQRAIGDLRTYLKDLETRIVMRPPGESDAARVHQLFNKTNQFNVTTKRYTLADVAGFMRNNVYDLRVVEVADKFGDLGTVGVILIDRTAGEPHIDSFVMSCRAMGREVETAIMNEIKRDYLQAGRAAALTAQYVATKKNKPVERFFDAQGFAVVEERDGTMRRYRLGADGAAPLPCEHIEITAKH